MTYAVIALNRIPWCCSVKTDAQNVIVSNPVPGVHLAADKSTLIHPHLSFPTAFVTSHLNGEAIINLLSLEDLSFCFGV
jgi:hypothetical protein